MNFTNTITNQEAGMKTFEIALSRKVSRVSVGEFDSFRAALLPAAEALRKRHPSFIGHHVNAIMFEIDGHKTSETPCNISL